MPGDRSGELLELVLSAVPAVVYLADGPGMEAIGYVSPGIHALTGFDADRFLADPTLFPSRLPETDRHELERCLDDLQNNGSVSLVHRFRTAEGQVRWLRHTLRRVAPDDLHGGSLIGCLVAADKRDAMEEDFRGTRGEVEQTDAGQRKAQSRHDKLLADIAHELKNPLSVVIGLAELLQEEEAGNHRVSEVAARMERAARRGAEIIGSLVARARRASKEEDPGPSGPANEAAPEARISLAESSPSPGKPHGLSVLVVDDDVEVAELIADILVADGHEVDIAGSGHEALEKIEGRRFDVILSDLRMPNLDGPGLYRALERREDGTAGRLAFVTGDTMSPEVRRFIESVACPCLEKPITPRAVRDLVRSLSASG